jgi:hypothetical protein
MDTLTRLIVCALAVYRLAEMIVIDNGPFGVFVEMRGWLQRGALDGANKTALGSIRREMFNGVTCVYCVGVWFAFVFAFLFYFQNIFTDFLIIFLAIAGLQSIVSTKLGRQ